MKICFPARKANGEQYATVDDMMQPLCQEPHGSWLAGTNNMWHGGIHITSKSAPGSVLTNETADTAVPLQFMAGGEVVAWRINQDYLTGKYINNPLQYSSTFVLVKSTCTPDPEKKDNSLDFYSLYIGLAPLSAFPEHKLYQVTDKGDGLSQREYTGKEKDGDKAPVAKNKLKTGDSVIVLREITFDLKGQAQTFGLARMLNSKSEMTGGAFWVSLDPLYMAPAGKQRAHLPAWMQQAVAQGTFDTVVKPASRMEVAAGDAVGYLAEDIAPCDLHGVEKSAFAHIEVISTDSRMVDFLSNKAQVKSGQKYVYIHPESFIYSRSGDTFTRTRGQVKKDIHKIMPQDKCHPFKDSSGKRWFDIGDGAWVSEEDVDADIGQYDLDKLGFKAFEEPSTSDMTKSLREGWIKDGFTRIAEWVRPERGIREKQVSDYYKALLRKMDSDNSGDLSGEELRLAVNYAEPDVRDIAARMVVRHDSEWFGGSSHHRWRTFLKQMDPLCISYVRQWFDDMEWMSKVDEFSSGEPVWHMHPVVFLNAINVGSEYEVTVELIEKLLGHTNPWFTGKRGGKAFSTHFKNNYPEVYEFDKQIFVSEFNEQLIAYGITGAYHKAHFLSQCLHESAHFDTTLEFGSGHNYDPGQHKDAVKNGNTVVGDGPRYKGRGLIQLTWKNNYRRFSSYSGVDCIANSELVASVMSNAIKASCWFWRNNGGVHKKYDAKGDINILIDNERNNVELITLAVNGGQNGLAERQRYFDAIKKEWGLE
ncbi:glycoside hydrolase family 19 protein [Franconibacter daqui]|uniref:glycoside hydrolase family 19 protein n=1 Tax=Franconibacter daqui TaxID=2047724 RepID=UPI0030D00827